MFGVGLPILFPIALSTYLVIYCQEIYMLYYVYKRPPTYDEKLAKAVLNNLQYASLFLLGFGFWQISNFQLLPYDEVPLQPKETKNAPFAA